MRGATLYKQLDDGRYVAFDAATEAYVVVPPEHVPPLAPVRLSLDAAGHEHKGKGPGGGRFAPKHIATDPFARAKERAAAAGRKSPTGADRLHAAYEIHPNHLDPDESPRHKALADALLDLDDRPTAPQLDAAEAAAKAVVSDPDASPDDNAAPARFARHVLAGVSAARNDGATVAGRKTAWMKVARRLADDLAAAHDAWIGQWSFTQTGEKLPGDMSTQAHRLWWPLHQVTRAGATPSPAMVKDLRAAAGKLAAMGALPPKLAAAVAAVQKATSPKRVPMRLSLTAPTPASDGGRKARALLLLAMVEFQRRAHAVGMPDAARPYLDHLAKLAGDPAAAKKAVRLSLHAQPAAPAYQPPPATDPAPYGYCPECRTPATHTERRPGGNSGCANGHTFPAKKAKYSNVGVFLDGEAAGRLLAMAASVRTEDLADDGREAEPHVTVRYGLHTPDPAAVAPFLTGAGPARLWLGRVSVFRGAESGKPYDVLKVDVDSPDLRRLNAALKALPHTDTHPEYKPHATIAYVKAGLGDAYAAAMPPLDIEWTAPEAAFSTPTREKTAVRLSWRAESYSDGKPRKYQFKAVGEGPDAGRVLYGADAQRAIERQQQRGTQAQEYDQQAAAVTGKQPAADAHPEQGYSHKEFKAKQQAAYKAASAVASLAVGREDITGDHLKELAGHLPYLTAAQLRSVRVRLNTAFDVSFGGKSRRAEMVGSVMNHVRAELDRMDKAAGAPVVDAPGAAAPKPRQPLDKPARRRKPAPELAPVLAHYATLPPDGPAAKAIDAAVANASPAGHDAANPPPKLDAAQLRRLRAELGHRHAEMHAEMSPEEDAGYAKMMESLGVKSLHAPGETKPFDPATMHSDTGMPTGTPVKVTRRGWTGLYGDAKVGHSLTGNNWQRAAVEPAAKPSGLTVGAGSGEAWRAVTGRDPDPAAVRALAGVPEGVPATVRHYDSPRKGPMVEVAAVGDGYRSTRLFYRDKAGKLVAVNHGVTVDPASPHKGRGTEAFAAQVESLRAAGVDRIETTAGGDATGGTNGYYTLPRWGYDGTLDDDQFGRLPPDVRKAMGDDRSLRKLFDAVPGGKEAWKKVGDEIKVSFDLRPGSPSSKALAAYTAERAKGEPAGKPAATGEADHPAVEQFAERMLQNAIADARKDNPEKLATLTEEQKENYRERMRQQARDKVAAINDPEKLHDAWGRGTFHPQNRESRRLFEAVTGVKLPSTVAGTADAIRRHLGDEFVGRKAAEADAAQKAEADAAAAEKTQKAAARDAEYDGFGADMTPMQREKARASLDRQVSANGEVVSVRDLIRAKVKDGWTVQDHPEDGRRLVSADGERHYAEKQLTKTALDYANHLATAPAGNLDNANTNAKVATTPQPAGPTDGELLGSTGGEADGLPARERVGGAAAAGAVAGEGDGAGAGPGVVAASADGPRAGAAGTDARPGDAAAGGVGSRPRRPARTRRVAEPGVARDPATGARLGGGLDGTAPAIPDPTPAEHVVAEAPAPDNPTDVSAGNFRYADLAFVAAGPKAKFNANLAAVRLLREMEAEGRDTATPEEQAVLSKFTGWGQFPGVFNEWRDAKVPGSDDPEHDPGKWAEERKVLRGLMSASEWEAAKRSTLNAHYTHPDVVDAHWKAAERLGFAGGRHLETSAGVGYYLGFMPPHLAARTRVTAVELDPTTGGMLKRLYPKSNVHVQGFQDHLSPDNYYDLVASNVPFGAYRVHDPKYNRHQANVHDYFFLKSADKVRPGGLMMHITSTGTLDKPDAKIREELYKTHDLVAAVRFPGAAHKQNAGTDVVTDMLVLRKRLPGEEPGDRSWLETTTVPDPAGGEAIPVNSYFAKNPDQILGTLDRTGSMYQENNVNVSRTADYEQRLAAALDRLPQNVMSSGRAPAKRFEPAVLPAPGEVKDGGFHVEDGKVFRRDGGQMTEQKLDAKAAAKVAGHLSVRDAFRAVIRAETAGEDATAARADLNKAYDQFVKAHGPLNAPANRKAFGDDPDSPPLLALEHYDPKAKTAAKADIFSKPTVTAAKPVEKVGSVAEGVGVSLHETGRLDVAHIAKLAGLHPDAVGKELVAKGLGYEDPSHGWQPADHYLSGNVRRKLLEARAAAAADPKFAPNVAALEKVQPEDVHHDDIDVRLGAPWVPPADVAGFATQLLNTFDGAVEVKYNPASGEWHAGFSGRSKHVQNSHTATRVWGTPDAHFGELLTAALNNNPVRVTRKGDDDKPVVDKDATDAANAKVQEIKEEFKNWVWADDARRERLHRHYNDNFNNVRHLKYDGSHLKFPGMNPAFQMRPHQRDFVWQVVTTGKGLAGHEVGTGKTATMIASAMELRRLGLARKPAIVCKKANVEAITQDALKLYPGAKILSTADMFDAAKRKQTISRIATGDYDVVVMTHDHMDLLPMRPETQRKYIEEEMAELETAYQDAWESAEGNKKNDRVVKQLAKAKENLSAKLAQALAADKKDDAVFFEDLGVDQLFVDEAHRYKTLPVYTKMRGLKGVPTGRSQRATNMLMRTRWLSDQNGGRGVVFATGTPIANTMVELYNMQKYLQPKELEERGLKSFDAWANTFGDIETRMEYTATGEYKPVSRFSKFVNLPELMGVTRQMLDVQRADDLKNPDGTPVIKRPKRKDAVTVAPKSDGMKKLMASLQERAQQLKGKKPGESDDNMLSICTDGRKGSIDLRLVYANAPDDPDSKANQMVRNVVKIGKANPGKTQMIFTDLARTNDLKVLDDTVKLEAGEGDEAPETAGRTGTGFDLVADIVAKLVKGGIPRDKILDFRTLDGKKKDEAVERLRTGDAMVAIGGTETLGTGVNAQHHLLALHHLDCPWRPADLEQRDGRGWRHGNTNSEVQIHRYVTEGSLDELLWQGIGRKAAFIKQIMTTGATVGRSAQEEDTEELTPEAVMAAASGDPRILQRVQLDADVKAMESAEKRHAREQADFAGRVKQADATARDYQHRIGDLEATVKHLADNPDFHFRAGPSYGSHQKYTERTAETAAAIDKFLAESPSSTYSPVAEYRGLDVLKKDGRFYLRTPGGREIRSGDTLAAVEAAARQRVRTELDLEQGSLAQYQKDTNAVREKLGKPFPKADALKQKRESLKKLEAELSGKKDDPAAEPTPEPAANSGGSGDDSAAAARPYYQMRGGEFVETPDAKPVAVPGHDSHEFFVAQDDAGAFEVVETRSGLAVARGGGEAEAVRKAAETLDRNKDRLAAVIDAAVAKSGPSPRHTP